MGDKFFVDEEGKELRVTLEGEDVPEPLRGKDLKEVVMSAAEYEKKVQELQSQLQTTQEYIDQLQKHHQPPTPSTTTAGAGGTKSDGDDDLDDEKLREELEKAPTKVISTLFDKRIQPLVETQIEHNLQVQMELARRDSTNFPEFEKYEEEVKKILANMPPQAKSQPGVLKTVFDVARVREADRILEEARKKAGVQDIPPSPPAPPPPKKVELTEDQKRYAQVFGMSEDEYAEWAKAEAVEGRVATGKKE